MNAPPAAPLDREMEVYKLHQMELVTENEGKFVLAHASGAISVFDDYEAALNAGYERYGLDPFLVKRVRREEPIHYFSRALTP